MTKAELRKLEIRYRLFGKIVEIVGMVVHRAIPWAGLVLIAYLQYLSIKSLAGRLTFAAIAVKFITDFHLTEGVAYTFGIGGVGYGLRQRKLRKDGLERMGTRTKELESKIDPGRSSSRLTSKGETHPEDKP
jgi:hypothetical protein